MDLPPVPCKQANQVSGIEEPKHGVEGGRSTTYVATGKVTTLEHEVGNDTVELGARVAKALLAGAESTEVLDSLGDDVVEELKVDAAGTLCNTDDHGQQVSNMMIEVELEQELELLLTLDGVVTSDLVAAGVNVDLRTGPGAVEENLDNHVCGCSVEGSGGRLGVAELVDERRWLVGEDTGG